MNDIKNLVENIIDYTKNWTISEIEWYYNIDCTRKPNDNSNNEITWKEFEIATRQEILYDLIYNDGGSLRMQLENDLQLCESADEPLVKESEALEAKIKKIIPDFEVERWYK